MKKVMFSIGSLYGGGAERVVSVWATQLCEAGYDVSILLYGRTDGEYCIDQRIKILCITERYEDFKKISFANRIIRMREIIKQESPHSIISFLQRNQIMVMLSCIGLPVKRIDTVRINPWKAYSNKPIQKLLWKECFRTCDNVIVQTAEQGDFFSKKVQKKCVVIPNPLNDEYMEIPMILSKGEPKRFVAAGRIDRQKNYGMMIEAFIDAHNKCPDIRLSIYGSIGDQLYKDELDLLISNNNASEYIRFCGRSVNMKKVYDEHDAFLLTSDYEGMPNALAEAMACGLICVSTNCKTGPKDMIEDGINGYLVRVADVNMASERIQQVAQLTAEQAIEIRLKARTAIMEICGKDRSIEVIKRII